jgi:hypothetical protein
MRSSMYGIWMKLGRSSARPALRSGARPEESPSIPLFLTEHPHDPR